MRIDEISRVLASLLRRTHGRMDAPAGTAADAAIKLAQQAVRDIEMRRASLGGNDVEGISASLEPGWEKDIAARREAPSPRVQPELNAHLRGQLLAQKMVRAARDWDSEYVPENRSERHPDNRFFEGVGPDGNQVYTPADHLARTFTPSPEDERLALLIVQKARAAAPELFREMKGGGGSEARGFDIPQLIMRAIGFSVLLTCAVLVVWF
jgi:hypothetical protein